MDKTGAFREMYAYDALGKRIGVAQFGTGTANYPRYFYTGQEFDEETGLHNFRARLYDDDLFRFYAIDAAEQYHSPYIFTGNSPLIYRDPDGRFAWFVPLIFAAVEFGIDLYRNDFKMNIGEIGKSLLSGAIKGTFAAMGANGVSSMGDAFQMAYTNKFPSMDVSIGGVNLSIGPSMSFGTHGLSEGISASGSVQLGNFTVGGSVGESFTSGGIVPGMDGSSWSASVFGGYNTENLSVLGAVTNYRMPENSGSPFNQVVGSVSAGSNGVSATHSNDFWTGSGKDQGRTAALEFGYKDVVVGIDVFTNNAGKDNTRPTSDGDSFWGENKARTHKNGEVYSSPLYVGIKSGGKLYKAGWDNPFFQDFMQNGFHKYNPSPSPYFKPGNYNRFYGNFGTYNRFIH